ncbi:hypothetical protein RCH23_001222 [Cryobacterium sp. CAN_C3]|uniref:hypothetical protein n=1 Tax=Cryobacterium sp. CAN_C3 TaxID=3071721 RepID=UPI0018CBC296|nr:hypothetical protein [Cryobacterium sp. CAN_C3]MEC5153849.1 hypothetical protein [Cryobacterium sp. CAN_C3]
MRQDRTTATIDWRPTVSSEKPDILRRPQYDHRFWVGFGPTVVVAVSIAWAYAVGIVTTSEYVLLFVLILLAFIPAMMVLAYTIDDARRGFRYTTEVQGLLYMGVPWIFSISLLVLARWLVFVSEAQFLIALGLVGVASLPALVYGAAHNHWNRNLPLRDPNGNPHPD